MIRPIHGSLIRVSKTQPKKAFTCWLSFFLNSIMVRLNYFLTNKIRRRDMVDNITNKSNMCNECSKCILNNITIIPNYRIKVAYLTKSLSVIPAEGNGMSFGLVTRT